MWPSIADQSRTQPNGSRLILVNPLQMETVTKILIKMRPLSIDGAIIILVLNFTSVLISNRCICDYLHWSLSSHMYKVLTSDFTSIYRHASSAQEDSNQPTF